MTAWIALAAAFVAASIASRVVLPIAPFETLAAGPHLPLAVATALALRARRADAPWIAIVFAMVDAATSGAPLAASLVWSLVVVEGASILSGALFLGSAARAGIVGASSHLVHGFGLSLAIDGAPKLGDAIAFLPAVVLTGLATTGVALLLPYAPFLRLFRRPVPGTE